MNFSLKRNRISYIELVFIALMAVLFISPEINRMVSLTQLLFIEILYSVTISFSDSRVRKIVTTNLACAFAIALLYTFTTEIVYIETGASHRFIKSILTVLCQYYSLTFPVLMFYRVAFLTNKTQRWILLAITVFSIISVMQYTLVELAINEKISKSGMGVSDDMNKKAIGGYSFICAIPLLATTLFYEFTKNKSVIIKVVFITLVFFSLFFIIKSQYSIALIAGFLGIMTAFIVFMKKNHRIRLIILITILLFGLPSILDLFINQVEGDVHLRMIEVRHFITTGELGDDDMAARMNLYGKSLVAFFESPLWGNYRLGFNAHSTFLEVLASLGILGAGPLFLCLKKSFKVLKSLIDRRLIVMLVIPFIFMGLTNPIHASLPLNMVLWFVCPLLYISLNNNTSHESPSDQRSLRTR